MPRKKNWRKSKSRRAVLGEQEALGVVSDRQNPASVQVQSPASMQALSPASMQAHNPASVQIQSPASEKARGPASVQANASKSRKDLEKGNTQKEFTNNVSQKDNEKGKTTATCIDLALSHSTHSWNACAIIF